MKYENEYRKSKNKIDFVNRVLKKYDVTESTAVRRYYDLRKKFNTHGVKQKPKPDIWIIDEGSALLNNPDIIPERPGMFKMLLFEDMKRFLKRSSFDEMKRQGFSMGEIKWLKMNKLI